MKKVFVICFTMGLSLNSFARWNGIPMRPNSYAYKLIMASYKARAKALKKPTFRPTPIKNHKKK